MATVDLALLRTSEMIQGTIAVLPPPGFKPRGRIILVIRTQTKVHLIYEPRYVIPRVGHLREQNLYVSMFELPTGVWM
jgi:hypothetical protein